MQKIPNKFSKLKKRFLSKKIFILVSIFIFGTIFNTAYAARPTLNPIAEGSFDRDDGRNDCSESPDGYILPYGISKERVDFSPACYNHDLCYCELKWENDAGGNANWADKFTICWCGTSSPK